MMWIGTAIRPRSSNRPDFIDRQFGRHGMRSLGEQSEGFLTTFRRGLGRLAMSPFAARDSDAASDAERFAASYADPDPDAAAAEDILIGTDGTHIDISFVTEREPNPDI